MVLSEETLSLFLEEISSVGCSWWWFSCFIRELLSTTLLLSFFCMLCVCVHVLSGRALRVQTASVRWWSALSVSPSCWRSPGVLHNSLCLRVQNVQHLHYQFCCFITLLPSLVSDRKPWRRNQQSYGLSSAGFTQRRVSPDPPEKFIWTIHYQMYLKYSMQSEKWKKNTVVLIHLLFQVWWAGLKKLNGLLVAPGP